MDYITLKELCEELSISTATGRNWIKLEKLTPDYIDKRTPYFSKPYVDILKTDIISGKNNALKSRRNKKYISGNALYNSYVSENCKNLPVLQKILSFARDKQIKLTTESIQILLADCALHLFAQKMNADFQNQKGILLKYLNHEISVGKYDTLINDLLVDVQAALRFYHEYPLLFNLEYEYESNEDILGLIYISCNNIGNRKATGSYYTPTKVVKKLIRKLDITVSSKILDPCCGTGNFLLQLPNDTCFENVYGNDIDSVSVKITRINMALKYPNAPVEQILTQITELNYLTEYNIDSFNYIIGNPPWGYEFSDEDKKVLREKYQTASGKNIESYDVFIEKSLIHLAQNGQLSFVLPEAILNVKSHMTIREIISQQSSIQYLEFLGNAFDGVQCPCIIFQIAATGKPLSTVGMLVNDGKQEFKIELQRNVSSAYFSFITNDVEYKILQKIKNLKNAAYLLNNADFALGIVTGSNKEYISSQKTSENEMVLKGADICKYHINPSNNYIIFKPDSFQQVAPTEMYRAKEKLLYRFICGQLVFAYDDKQTLSLNSCNIVIPKLPNLKMKYILAILNSRVAQFIYKKDFNSVKVLRSHIESIPIPAVDAAIQDEIIQITDALISNTSSAKASELYEQLDRMIFKLFQLSVEEQNVIKSAVDGENKFLV